MDLERAVVISSPALHVHCRVALFRLVTPGELEHNRAPPLLKTVVSGLLLYGIPCVEPRACDIIQTVQIELPESCTL